MTHTTGGPSHNAHSYFRCEEGVVTDYDRNARTLTVETRHSNKTIHDVRVISPYHHYLNGEGIDVNPEIGAICHIAWPSDNTPPFILGFLDAPSVLVSEDGSPQRSTSAAEGSPTDVSFQSRRPPMNPGDIALRTRDDNFIFLRRGGIVQIGATPVAQRIYLPVLNYIKDFAENYEMNTFGGDIQWTVGRQEQDPSGDAPATYVFHLNEFAQDAKATVRIQHLPVSQGDKTAWSVHIAPQGINRDDGSVQNEKYSLLITTGGEKTEIISAGRTVEVKGDDRLTISGSRTVDVSGDCNTTADGNIKSIAGQTHVVGGSIVKQGSEQAASPSVKGDALLQFFATATFIVDPSTSTAVMSPASAAAMQMILSQKVFLE